MATISGTCYLIGGYTSYSTSLDSTFKRVLSVSLDELVSQAQISKPASAPTLSPWQILPSAPLVFSTPLVLNGILLAVGGLDAKNIDYKAMNTIYAYHPERKEWMTAGELPVERAKCSCIVLPSGEIMVIGADIPSPVAQQVHLATVL